MNGTACMQDLNEDVGDKFRARPRSCIQGQYISFCPCCIKGACPGHDLWPSRYDKESTNNSCHNYRSKHTTTHFYLAWCAVPFRRATTKWQIHHNSIYLVIKTNQLQLNRTGCRKFSCTYTTKQWSQPLGVGKVFLHISHLTKVSAVGCRIFSCTYTT